MDYTKLLLTPGESQPLRELIASKGEYFSNLILTAQLEKSQAPRLYEACKKSWNYFLFRPAKTDEIRAILHQLEQAIALVERK